MKKDIERHVFNSLKEQYLFQNLPTDLIDDQTDFTIHNIRDIHPVLPYTSIVYRVNFFSFVFVKSGTGRYTTDEQIYTTRPGTIYFTNPGHFKSFEWQELDEVYLITLSESFLKENVHADIFEEFPFLLAETVAPRVLPPEEFAVFEQLYLLLKKEYESTSFYRNKVIGNLFVVLLLKIKEFFWKDYNPIYEGNRSSQIVKTFKRGLEKHYRDMSRGVIDKPFRVQEYAASQGLHPNYLSNVIKTKTGKSISTWVSEKTIAEAKSLLQNSTKSIKEIAYLLGFGESTHFSNYFKKHTRQSPVVYRKELKS
ncbi:AraC family transcriptional regulator [Chitinophaga sancti]|uniref:AraC family transcriptional regulator n=1 Tax=Chitinophaga sancti TaxID=1004 RepID=UPI002A75C926|nr:AraC family transcriptional regulator [Chitinophaga sancti]WPQ61978.1 AraC family transcriptional regulator [Chitinophaga sancti]